MFQNNAMFKPCWGIIILLLVKSVKLGQLFPMGKNQGNDLINVSYSGRASDDNTVLFLCHSLHKVISAKTLPKMWKGGEEVLRNVWEDGRRYLCKIWLKSCQILQKSNTLTDMEATSSMKHWLAEAYKEAQLGLAEGGLPIGILCWILWSPLVCIKYF